MALSTEQVSAATSLRRELLGEYNQVRSTSIELCRPLKAEDYRIQSMPDVSPPWWNLGHTSWFFAKNILEPFARTEPADQRLEYVLNSYYESLGARLPRVSRGLLTRPTTEEILQFRQSVDRRMRRLIEEAPETSLSELDFLVRTGIHHEQQHQELLLSELKHILFSNPEPLREAYCAGGTSGEPIPESPLAWAAVEGGVCEFGNLEGGWCFDNELPVHRHYLEDFEFADRLIVNREYLEFMEDGGYGNPLLWLSNGWDHVQREGWRSPLYWENREGEWYQWTLSGMRPVRLEEPVCHVSFYEAHAFVAWKSEQGAAWKGVRLPWEREWEQAARSSGRALESSNFAESGVLHPVPADPSSPGLKQMMGDVWEWTLNHYEPYPGYQAFSGNLMEYNSKFMDNQRILRGGSCATPRSHIRISYRNFWYAATRFQFTGIRLAR